MKADREGTLYLEGVALTLYDKDGRVFHVESRKASFNRESNEGALQGDVILKGPEELELRTARLNLKQKGERVISQGPAGDPLRRQIHRARGQAPVRHPVRGVRAPGGSARREPPRRGEAGPHDGPAHGLRAQEALGADRGRGQPAPRRGLAHGAADLRQRLGRRELAPVRPRLLGHPGREPGQRAARRRPVRADAGPLQRPGPRRGAAAPGQPGAACRAGREGGTGHHGSRGACHPPHPDGAAHRRHPGRGRAQRRRCLRRRRDPRQFAAARQAAGDAPGQRPEGVGAVPAQRPARLRGAERQRHLPATATVTATGNRGPSTSRRAAASSSARRWSS